MKNETKTIRKINNMNIILLLSPVKSGVKQEENNVNVVNYSYC